MGWISIDIRCNKCEHRWDDIVDRARQNDFFECPECGGNGERIMSAPMVMNAALPDGNNRFAHLKEQQKLKRAAAEAKERGDFVTEKKIKKEKEKIK